MKKFIRPLAVVAVALIALTGCTEIKAASDSSPEKESVAEYRSPTSQEIKDRAKAVLPLIDTVNIIPEVLPMTGYSRDQFPHWSKMNKAFGWEEVYEDGCTSRQAALIQEGSDVMMNGYCDILSGNWKTRYGHIDDVTGEVVAAGENITDPSLTDVDHIIALAAGWRLGASEWTIEKRESFANDPNNLIVTGATENRQKGDKLPDIWVPYDSATACEYLVRHSEVTIKYDLNMTPGLKESITKDLNRCVNEDAPYFWTE